MKRICPSCKSVLSMSSVYFCEFCGAALPEDMHLNASQHQNVKKIVSKKKSSNNSKTFKEYLLHFSSLISMRSVILGFVLGIIVSLFFFLFFKTESYVYVSKLFKSSTSLPVDTSQNLRDLGNQVSSNKGEEDYIELGLTIKSGIFNQHEVRDYIPYEASFYMEFNDISTLEPYFGFLGGELFTLNENVVDKVEPFYAAFYMSKGIKSGWTLLLFPKDEELDVGDYDDIFIDKVERSLVISLEPVLIDEVKLAKSEVVKNLSMHPSLISMEPFLPDSGQILIAKLKKDGDGVVEKLEEDTTSEELQNIIESYMDYNSPYLVIK